MCVCLCDYVSKNVYNVLCEGNWDEIMHMFTLYIRNDLKQSTVLLIPHTEAYVVVSATASSSSILSFKSHS